LSPPICGCKSAPEGHSGSLKFEGLNGYTQTTIASHVLNGVLNFLHYFPVIYV